VSEEKKKNEWMKKVLLLCFLSPCKKKGVWESIIPKFKEATNPLKEEKKKKKKRKKRKRKRKKKLVSSFQGETNKQTNLLVTLDWSNK